jgi:ferredoxin
MVVAVFDPEYVVSQDKWECLFWSVRAMQFISNENLFSWLDELKTDYEVYVPFKKGPFRFYQRYTSPSPDIVIGEVRATEPVKGFFTPVKEKVAELFNPEPIKKKQKPMAIVGVNRAREDNLIISADCTQVIDTCFCLALDVNPYPESHFDINLSEVTGGFIVEVGSPKGQQVFDSHKTLFQEVDTMHVTERKEGRKQVVAEVKRNIAKHGVPHQDEYQGMIERNHESIIWEDEAKTCTECGACTTICPTCHCFTLADQKEGDQFVRYRQWDSCMLKDYARVAGGGNPRPQLSMRLRNRFEKKFDLRNRFEKKFDFFPQVAGINACTGCGRCITACPANIDIRRVLKRLVHNE